jgi:uncharacterized protein (TIGR00661 family)
VKILYGVTGEGLGHTMRARALVQHLVAAGHQVKIAASGRAVAVLRQHHPDTVAIDGLRIAYERGAVHRRRTLLQNVRDARAALTHNIEVGMEDGLDFDPDAVVTDFDSFAYVIGRLLERPIISFDHQHVLDRFHHTRSLRRTLAADFAATRVFVHAKTPRCSHFVVTSFFFPEVRSRYASTTTLVGPVVRAEIEQARPTSGDHVLVYQTASGDPNLLPALRATPNTEFVVYGLGAERRDGNVHMRSFDEARFISDLASARAVVSNGGFTTLSEAIYLGKPVLSVPVRHQAEQELNAAYLESLGLGMRAARVDAHVLARFLDRLGDFHPATDRRMKRGNVDACAAIDALLARAKEAA